MAFIQWATTILASIVLTLSLTTLVPEGYWGALIGLVVSVFALSVGFINRINGE